MKPNGSVNQASEISQANPLNGLPRSLDAHLNVANAFYTLEFLIIIGSVEHAAIQGSEVVAD